MRRWSTAPGKKACPQEQLLIAFRRATSRFGGTCLVKAIALQRLLSNYGYPSELRIGALAGEGCPSHDDTWAATMDNLRACVGYHC